MINPEMAQKLIDQITGCTEYNINIMDGSGIIIASRDPARIREVAMVIRLAIEAMLKYEREQERLILLCYSIK